MGDGLREPKRCRDIMRTAVQFFWPNPGKFKGTNGRKQRLKALEREHPCNMEAD